MSEVFQEHPDQNILDALELALRDIEYEPILDPDEEVPDNLPKISSGSVRIKVAYDYAANALVRVVEYLGWAEQDPDVGIEEIHRLIVWWDDGSQSEEYDLDTHEVIFEEEDTATEQAKGMVKQKLMQALRAVMTD